MPRKIGGIVECNRESLRYVRQHDMRPRSIRAYNVRGDKEIKEDIGGRRDGPGGEMQGGIEWRKAYRSLYASGMRVMDDSATVH